MVDVRFLCKGRLLLRVFKSYTILLLSSLTRMPVKYFILSFTVVAATSKSIIDDNPITCTRRITTGSRTINCFTKWSFSKEI